MTVLRPILAGLLAGAVGAFVLALVLPRRHEPAHAGPVPG